jgi:hypothetical protein
MDKFDSMLELNKKRTYQMFSETADPSDIEQFLLESQVRHKTLFYRPSMLVAQPVLKQIEPSFVKPVITSLQTQKTIQ